MVYVVLIAVAVWVALLVFGPLLGATRGLTLALVLSGLVGWIAARIVPDQLRRYQPALQGTAPRSAVRIAARTTITNLSATNLSVLLVSCLIGTLYAS